MSPIPKSQQKAVNKYSKTHYDRVNLIVPKGQRDIFRAHAQEQGESLNAFVCRAIRETMERDINARKLTPPQE